MAPVPLEDDSLIEILSLLPLPSLARLKSVSKSWCELISSPGFHKKLRPYISTYSLIVRLCNFSVCPFFWYARFPSAGLEPVHAILEGALSSIPHYPQINIVDSSNGLLFYYTSFYPELYNVYNLARQERVVLPIPTFSGFEAVGLAFDSCISPHFKVVFISSCKVDRRWIAVYSSEKGRWFWLDFPEEVANDLGSLRFTEKKPVFAGGALYFEAFQRKLVRFNFNEETIDIIGLDQRMVGDNNKLRIGECKGHLHYAEYDSLSCRVQVWKLDVRSCAWVLMFGGSIPPCCSSDKVVKIEALHPDDEEIVFLRLSDRIYMHSLCSMKGSLICVGAHSNAFGKEGEVFPIRPCFLQSFRRPSRALPNPKKPVGGKKYKFSFK